MAKTNSNNFNFMFILIILIVMILAAFLFNSCKNSSVNNSKIENINLSEESKSSETTTQTTTTIETATETTIKDTPDSTTETALTETTTTTSDTKQIIEVTVKGGYYPQEIKAKAEVSTILRLKSVGAIGCERTLIFPQFNISNILPEYGITDFNLDTRNKGAEIIGVCSMEMYYFKITFN
ncbi:hypothetical protein A2Y99_02580 [Candidatus Gottesmanbacteria bacterium RBG_13_37_7]|uniref:EfeO-type cupredoxin-like domain-containing protein n=1 Tax=Candidatus Gottesmanbacteria bacterium RBG_13_37_7 TaxID=1798369 RepID=A0A1F5YK87_9BACT|nr:MAG: hypothetical protein A2Y99_02580 [Candidatus Gottesmanbacteria bacterium RBG_13_37_7]